MNAVFSQVGGARPPRSAFDLSYEKKFTCDMGQLIPVLCDEAVPGDRWQIANDVVVRFMPMVAPILHEVNVFVHYFFVPYRLLWSDWEKFISGGEDGTYTTTIPRWSPTSTAEGSLWDYMGFPTGVTPNAEHQPLAFPRGAYQRIYNEYYRDENLTTAVAETTETLRVRAWEKDYFTSALPWQQRGTAPALPISGSTAAVWAGNVTVTPNLSGGSFALDGTHTIQRSGTTGITYGGSGSGTAITMGAYAAQAAMNANTVDLSPATTFNVSDLRLAFQIQRWLERNARAGARYTEFLASHFGVAPRDERLQRAEYIGGTRAPLFVSEVLQTSEAGTTPQGTMAGHGLAASSNFVGKYNVQEYGLIMGILSVMPRTVYQQGIDRQWLRRTKYDFYFPEFANLSEQAIERAEIYTSAVKAENETIFGYQGRYDELRVKRSMVCGALRSTLDHWHVSRQFGAAPLLNTSFVECVPRKDWLAVPAQPTMVVSFGNRVACLRPLPMIPDPGRTDHN